VKTLRWLCVCLALSVSAACSGGGSGSHVAPVVTSVSSPAPAATVSGPKSTMTITIVRSPAATSSVKRRGIQTIPATALSVDAQIWEGSSTAGAPVATSCVSFPANATTATLSVASPQGLTSIQIASWSAGCSASGGPGTTGTGSMLSVYTGTGTVLPASTDIGVVFNNGNAIALVTPSGGTGTILVGPTTFTIAGFGPAWGAPGVASQLNYPVQSGFDGTGMTVAIVIDSSVASSDLSTYLTTFSIPTTGRTITFESVDGANQNLVVSNGDQVEAALDLETVAGLAPGANVIVYVMPDLSDTSIVDAYNQIISDGHANVVNSSFGGCENSEASIESPIFATGTAAKIAFVASAGDQGSACFDGSPFSNGVNYPASDPNVIGVGGTDTNTFEPGVTLTNPVVWNDGPGFGVGGGGVSALFPIPAYQQTVSGFVSTTNRNVPDISGPGTYSALYVNGAWTPIDGTSWSSPQFAAELSEIYQYCRTAFVNPVSLVYTAYNRSHSDFIDVTSGNNMYPDLPGSPTYNATIGVDNVSGLGVPLGMNVAQSLCPGRVPTFSPVAQINTAVLGPAAPVLVPLATTVSKLASDVGERAAGAVTTVQFVLRNVSGMAGNEQAVLAALTTSGFTITKTFSNHLVIDASAPNAAVESFLSTTVHDVSQGALGMRHTRVGSLTIPASIAPYVAGVHVGNLVRVKAGPVRHR
jgi:hypothetical protein